MSILRKERLVIRAKMATTRAGLELWRGRMSARRDETTGFVNSAAVRLFTKDPKLHTLADELDEATRSKDPERIASADAKLTRLSPARLSALLLIQEGRIEATMKRLEQLLKS